MLVMQVFTVKILGVRLNATVKKDSFPMATLASILMNAREEVFVGRTTFVRILKERLFSSRSRTCYDLVLESHFLNS